MNNHNDTVEIIFLVVLGLTAMTGVAVLIGLLSR